MQKTETHQLNLIQMDDNFSPEPLNENARKLDAALAALDSLDEAHAAGIADLDQRLKTFEAHRVVTGIYQAGGVVVNIDLDFTPKIVFIHGLCSANTSTILMQNPPKTGTNVQGGSIRENGFTVNQGNQAANYSYNYYLYFALD